MNAHFKTIARAAALAVLCAVMPGLVPRADAMPNFARKYSLSCSACHTVVPRLNETGFNFRAAGYRMPDEIGKAIETFNLGDYITGAR
jgi:hypothetical protein